MHHTTSLQTTRVPDLDVELNVTNISMLHRRSCLARVDIEELNVGTDDIWANLKALTTNKAISSCPKFSLRSFVNIQGELQCSKLRLTNPEEWRPSPLVRHPGKFRCGHNLYTLGPDIRRFSSLWTTAFQHSYCLPTLNVAFQQEMLPSRCRGDSNLRSSVENLPVLPLRHALYKFFQSIDVVEVNAKPLIYR
ncbi:Uncharacterized protein Fot_32675 [Forsythia ovata]|uniref:Uncharacterized protein n=1 Tax=Forsythia ovata TaxID=205694 RepID=A0ABD1T926_9LAMI